MPLRESQPKKAVLVAHVAYQDDEGRPCEAILTNFVQFGDERFSSQHPDGAFLLPLAYDRVVGAIDTETGLQVSIREVCGARPPPSAERAALPRRQRPKGRGRSHGTELFKGQRRQDSKEFIARFGPDIIWNHYRNKLIATFEGRCFACGDPSSLQLDHHVPLARGGRREPGNIVVLCFSCNILKSDCAPEEFYSPEELAALGPMLSAQTDTLDFAFSRERWHSDPVSYLISIGISPILVREVVGNPDHPWALLQCPAIGVTISAE